MGYNNVLVNRFSTILLIFSFYEKYLNQAFSQIQDRKITKELILLGGSQTREHIIMVLTEQTQWQESTAKEHKTIRHFPHFHKKKIRNKQKTMFLTDNKMLRMMMKQLTTTYSISFGGQIQKLLKIRYFSNIAFIIFTYSVEHCLQTLLSTFTSVSSS